MQIMVEFIVIAVIIIATLVWTNLSNDNSCYSMIPQVLLLVGNLTASSKH